MLFGWSLYHVSPEHPWNTTDEHYIRSKVGVEHVNCIHVTHCGYAMWKNHRIVYNDVSFEQRSTLYMIESAQLDAYCLPFITLFITHLSTVLWLHPIPLTYYVYAEYCRISIAYIYCSHCCNLLLDPISSLWCQSSSSNSHKSLNTSLRYIYTYDIYSGYVYIVWPFLCLCVLSYPMVHCDVLQTTYGRT